MNLKIYPIHDRPKDGYTSEEIRRGLHWIYTDVQCPHCGKLQPVVATLYLGGPCCACGQLTGGIKNDSFN